MKMIKCILTIFSLLYLNCQPFAQTDEEVFQMYWTSKDQNVRKSLEPKIQGLGFSFDSLYSKLKNGRKYSDNVPKGKLIRTHKIQGKNHHYMIFVPSNYNPKYRYPILWDLHGGMGQPEWKKPDGSWSGYGKVTTEEYRSNLITVVPAGWWGSMWWENSQVENFRKILDEVKSTWNINENRVFINGNSDGAIATWFYAFRYPDPWAFYFGYVGFPARLTNNYLRPDGQMHLSNLEGQNFRLINGVKDQIVNIDVMRKYLKLFENIDVNIDYDEHANDGHDLRLTKDEKEDFGIWLRRYVRDPLPDKLSWATERTDRYNRHYWIIIEELFPSHPIDKSNILPRIYGKNVHSSPPPPAKSWGQLKVNRKGNTIEVKATGVKQFKLLLSPEDFDLDSSISIIVNGKNIVNKKVEKSIETLLKWHTIDNDREMLFAAEMVINVVRDN